MNLIIYVYDSYFIFTVISRELLMAIYSFALLKSLELLEN